MKRLILFILICVSYSLFSEEVKKEISTGENGEKITTIHYANDKNNVIKRVYFGDLPKYRKVVEYFDDQNSEYINRSDYYEFDFGDPLFPNGKAAYGEIFYRKNNPFEYVKDEVQVDGIYTVQKFYYIAGNSQNLQNRIVVSLGTEKIVSTQEIYTDETKAKDNVHIKSIFYNEYEEVIRIFYQYFKNTSYKTDKDVYYDPPVYSEKDGNPWKAFINYYPNPEGFLKSIFLYFPNEQVVVEYTFDPKYTLKNFTRVMEFYSSQKQFREVRYFGEQLYEGKVYFVNTYFNEDGSVKSNQFYDKNEKEVFLD